MTDRLVVVTGTTSGVGEAVARESLARGWRVVGVARRGATLHHERYEHLAADLGDLSRLEREIRPRLEALLGESTLGRVGLVNNAADGALLGPIANMDVTRLPAVLATNVVAPIWLMGQVVRRVSPTTPLRIVNVSTAAAVRGFAGLGAYGSGKAGLRMAGMVLAAELEEARGRGQPLDVAILSYEPGTVDTPMQRSARSSSRETLPSVDMFVRIAAERRLVAPEGPAREIVEFLESQPEASFSEKRYAGKA
jgi:benzil reductase ((S)-benzoin forming)